MLTDPLPTTVPTVRWEDFALGPAARPKEPKKVKMFRSGVIDLRVDYGHARLEREDTANLRPGGVIPLEEAAAVPVDVYADGELIARGDVIEVEGKLGVRIVELVS